ncbi:MAG: metallophosphoesterase family protein [Elusimicrobia bacterium]|nr:metallophosphoesterase family protein [Elusimicrobiota bacterium]
MSIRDHAKPHEIAVLFAFLSAVGLTAALEFRWLLHRWLHRRETPCPRFWPFLGPSADRALTAALHAAAAGGLLCILYGRFIEPRWLAVRFIEIHSEKVLAQTGRLRIAHLSDFHSEQTPIVEIKAAEAAAKLKPDLIVVTGDFINTEAGLPTARRALEILSRAGPLFLVTGNFDIGLLPDNAFKGIPATVLDRQTIELTIRGTPVRITGLPVENEGYFPLILRKLPRKPALDIFLDHYSDLIDAASQAGFDLYLAGHTHGGQVRLPWYGALVTLAKTGKEYESGLYLVRSTTLHVSRGLGMMGEQAPRVRFLCRPELTIIDLVP